jgi:ATP-dependent Clp protease ATP-binding subunit ClpC
VALFDGDPVGPFVDEARGLSARLRRTLARVLLTQEPRRDACALVLQELDEGRALDLYLVPLLSDLERRGWTAQVHFDGDKGPKEHAWPSHRRWGPARTVDQAQATVLDNSREIRNVLLLVRGPYAGALLALEAGTHRFLGVETESEKVQLYVRLVAMRATFSDDEWSTDEILPRAPQDLEGPKKQRPVRTFDVQQGRVFVEGSDKALPARLAEYWPRFEEVALEHLVPYETDDGRDRESAFVGSVDEKKKKDDDE